MACQTGGKCNTASTQIIQILAIRGFQTDIKISRVREGPSFIITRMGSTQDSQQLPLLRKTFKLGSTRQEPT